MDQNTKRFLGIAFVWSYICFGIVIASRQSFFGLSTPMFALYLLGCLGPLAGAAGVYWWDRKSLGGFCGMWRDAMGTESLPRTLWSVLFFLVLHYGLAALLGAVSAIGSVKSLLRSLPIMLVLFGTGEIGWRGIVQPGVEAVRGGFWRSSIITGLFWALWFLPMLFIPGFVIRSDFYLQFTAYLVGIGLLLTTLYQKNGLLSCILFTTLFFSLSAVVILPQSNYLLAVVAVDLVVATAYNSKLFQA
ncbi:MAG: type II CAAX prenyl endopeptidase Rce1 family protein [Oscillospiraceae bacterium]|jgi:membrane protease YdiL (CAAX protease family)